MIFRVRTIKPGTKKQKPIRKRDCLAKVINDKRASVRSRVGCNYDHGWLIANGDICAAKERNDPRYSRRYYTGNSPEYLEKIGRFVVGLLVDGRAPGRFPRSCFCLASPGVLGRRETWVNRNDREGQLRETRIIGSPGDAANIRRNRRSAGSASQARPRRQPGHCSELFVDPLAPDANRARYGPAKSW